MPGTTAVSASKGGLRATAYRGDAAVLLAFNLDQEPQDGFAGFAVKCTLPDGHSFFLKNRLNFQDKITAATTPEERRAILTTTDKAPYQKFRWVDFSSSRGPGKYTYEVSAMYQKSKNGDLEPRASVDVALELGPFVSGKLQVGFTRGFVSSQAYVDQFHNAPIRPPGKSIDFDTKPFEKQYQWLGFHARVMIFDFLRSCLADPHSTIDVFAYDLDEPDIIGLLTQFGGRLRAFLDDAPLHTKAGALEIDAKEALVKSAGAQNVKSGHFGRFAHSKVFIQKQDGQATRVLTGSANFSLRGLYVQANNVLVFDDPATTGFYEQAFEQAFNAMHDFAASEIAEGWIEVPSQPSLPPFALAFSPHQTAEVSLGRVADAIKNAESSVLFAVMDLTGGGAVIDEITALTVNQPSVFSYGVTQSMAGASVYKPGSTAGILTPFAYLQQNVPAPFSQEISGGAGQVIHDKFVVVDFNAGAPVVFTGSSNLAAGGEKANGDNLIAIRDSAVASIFAVQAVGLVDHFHFRAVMQNATDDAPLVLRRDNWWKDYYTPGTLKFRDRMLFGG
jgi:hypothetical protein